MGGGSLFYGDRLITDHDSDRDSHLCRHECLGAGGVAVLGFVWVAVIAISDHGGRTWH